MKCTKCRADVVPSNKFCGACGQKVEIDDHEDKIKRCPCCDSLQKLSQKFCTDCGCEIDNKNICLAETDKGRCKNVLPPNSKFCSACGNTVKKSAGNDELDSGKQPKPKVTQIPRKQNNEENDVNDENGNTNSGSEREEDTVLEDNQGGTSKKNDAKEETLIKRNEHVELAGEAPPTERTTRGLAVICTHHKFNKKFKLLDRNNAGDDKQLMSESWKWYGCEILPFEDKKSEFYQKDLVTEIEGKLKKMGTIDYFVFVLSTHGDESLEVNLKDKKKRQYEHYFYTKDDRYKTQDVIDAIGEITDLDEKLKMFFIQACRSRFMNAEVENQDIGHTISVLSSIDEEKHSGFDQPDTVGHMPVEDDKMAQSISKTKSIDVEDARGYMPPPEKENDSTSEQIPQKLSTTMEKRMDEMTSTKTIEKTEVEEVIEIPTTVSVPHCDDCVVVFASMTGKYAYSRLYDSSDGGGWMIRALHSTMIKQQKPGDNVHVLDILTGINREISRKENVLKLKSQKSNAYLQRQTYGSYLSVILSNVDQKIKKEETSQQLLLKVKEYLVREDLELFESKEDIELLKVKKDLDLEDLKLLKVKKNLEMGDLQLLKEKEKIELLKVKEDLELLNVNEDLKILCLKVEVEQEIYKLEDEIKDITIRAEHFIGEVTLKAQSCFFHNLAFDDEHMKLKYQSKV